MYMPRGSVYLYPFLHTYNKVQKINATTFDDPAILPHKIFVPHAVDFNMIHLFTSGHGSHFLDFTEVKVKPGYIMFVTKGQIQNFDPNETYNGKSLIFTDDFFSREISHHHYLAKTKLYNDPLKILYFDTGERFNEISVLFDFIIEELKRPVHEHQATLLHNYLYNILLISETMYMPQKALSTTYKNNQLVANFKKQANLNIHERWTVETYAKMLNTTVRTLQNAFARHERSSPKNWLSERTVLEIKRRLIYEHQTIKEITIALNFTEATNLIKFFKMNTGFTPSEFKQSVNRQYRN